MADLNTLLQIDDAIGAFQFSAKGELLEYKLKDDSPLDKKVLDLLCHVCVANLAIATMQARGWEQMTGMQGFYPVEGIGVIGLEWTVIVNDEFGVILPKDGGNIDQVYASLNGNS